MEYRQASYYKEFQELIHKLRSVISEVKKEKEKIFEENDLLSRELKSLRSLLSDAQKEIKKVKAESEALKASKIKDEEASVAGKSLKQTVPNNFSPSLFDDLDSHEKIALKQEIAGLIKKINHHLEKSA